MFGLFVCSITSCWPLENRVTSAPVKEALYGLSTLLLELSRADADEASIRFVSSGLH